MGDDGVGKNHPSAISLGVSSDTSIAPTQKPWRRRAGRSCRRVLRKAKRLVHVGHDLDDLVDEIAILVLDDFGDETRADPLVVFGRA